jgi:hypothetical protein
VARWTLRQALLVAYAGLCAGGAMAVAALGGAGQVAADPLRFVLLVGALILLDRAAIELPSGGHTTPTTVVSVAIAFLFGPFGIVAAEAVAAGRRRLEGVAPLRNTFDLGALGLSGAAAYAAAQPFPAHGVCLLAAGTAAGAAYHLVNSALLTTAWSLDERRNPFALWRERLAGGIAHELAYGPLAALLVLGLTAMGELALALVVVPVGAVWFGQRHAMRAIRESVDELRAANERQRRLMQTTVESLARTIEARDPYTGGHTERVGQLAEAIARRLGFDDDALRAVRLGAVIHDIGKIGVPDAVLLKDGPLDDDEWAAMRRHPEIGCYILGDLELPASVTDMTRHHHERWDGCGYPDGLSGEQIPLAARVLTVADAVDAMTSDRPYRPALPTEAAIEELRTRSGTQFCPLAAAAAIDVLLGAA